MANRGSNTRISVRAVMDLDNGQLGRNLGAVFIGVFFRGYPYRIVGEYYNTHIMAFKSATFMAGTKTKAAVDKNR